MGRRLTAALVLALVLGAGACGGDDSDDSPGAQETTAGHGHGTDEEFPFGQPADPADADRTVEVTTLDTMAFDPDPIEIEPGETVAFSVTNEGRIAHEFFIGDEHAQDTHSGEMSGGHGMGEPNVLDLEPGETEEIAWTFPESGDVFYACHYPGHYEAGMVGTFDLSD